MITKTHKVDLGLGVPEKKKKKKKKKVVKEPGTHYSVLSCDDYFVDASPIRAASPSKNVGQAQAHEVPLVKKKKKKKGRGTLFEERLDSETRLSARRTEASPSRKKQALGRSESFSKEKKKKRKSSSLIMSHGSVTKTSQDTRNGEEVTRVGKKLRKHKKGKKAEDIAAFSSQDPWLYEAGDAPYAGSLENEVEEQAASGQKRKQGSPRESSAKLKKKKKIHQEGDALLGHSRLPRATESSPRKGRKKKPVTVDVQEYIPIGDGPTSPVKKKVKSKKKAEQPVVEELTLKRKKKKKRKESGVTEVPWKEEPDTDLEVVLEKKGNMDEAHIDQVRRKALQEEIDRESGKTEASEAGGNWTDNVGRILCHSSQDNVRNTGGPVKPDREGQTAQSHLQKGRLKGSCGGWSCCGPAICRRLRRKSPDCWLPATEMGHVQQTPPRGPRKSESTVFRDGF
ncbi:lysine-rich nucleolar protein 1 isoform X2 [Marmota marmota marmota]|uniref:lysine-rich nucleolar protein 1 isoform X2 n=1 Tax=Marmota marmota marmota TaxID=9994 RepID=UPI002093836F|nr:lysine-rich nucleolar protein 1 isoform X2 [Marmota marmota marmota]